MAKLEECVRSVQMDGLLWGASKLVPVGYGIKKLQINCVVEDDKVGTDILEEEITKFEDYVGYLLIYIHFVIICSTLILYWQQKGVQYNNTPRKAGFMFTLCGQL